MKDPALEDAHAEPRTALIFGGTSEIALAIARKLIDGRLRQVVLAVREPDGERAVQARADLVQAGATSVDVVAFDAMAPETHEAVVAAGLQPGLLVVSAGVHVLLPNQKVTIYQPKVSLTPETRLLVISSVAAVRPRATNYLYGSTKAGLDAFGRGLSDDLEGTGVRVSVLRPGFVRSRMTEGMEEQPFTADPDEVAEAAVTGMLKDHRVIWAPAALQGVFGVMSVLPGPIWRRLSKR